jgi:hypothetical protein
MEKTMKRWLAIFVLVSMPAFAQQKPNPPVPQLNTAERVALQSSEKAKQDLQKQWIEIMQQEKAILDEFNAAHPGYHVNQQTLAVEADSSKVTPVLPAKK